MTWARRIVARNSSNRRRHQRALVACAVGLLVLGSAPALADQITNNLDDSVDSTAEVVNVTSGTDFVVGLSYIPTADPGAPLCNLSGGPGTKLVAKVTSSDTSVVTVTEQTFTATFCHASGNLHVHALARGTATVTLTVDTSKTVAQGSFDLTPAAFRVIVDANVDPNPPVVTVPAPVTAEATGPGGAVVAYQATASDVEDGTLTPLCDWPTGSLFPLGATTVTCAVTDSGGLTTKASFVVTVVDTTAPSVMLSTPDDTTDSTTGWYNVATSQTDGVVVKVDASDQVGVVGTTCTDNGTAVYSGGTSGDVTLGEGTHHLQCLATDAAGNSGSASGTYLVDQTRPTISGSASPAPNDAGWNRTDVTVAFQCNDDTSGVATSTAPVVLGEGAGQHVDGSCTDKAGNVATTSVNGINVDETVPSVSPTVSPNPVVLNGVAATDAGATDALSGIDTSSVACGALDLSTVGPKSVSCSASDIAGNEDSRSATYDVTYASSGTCLGSPGHAVLQPINADNTSVFKLGSTVPAKFRVCDANGASIGSPGVVRKFVLKSVNSAQTTNVNETVGSTTPDTAFRWDPTAQQWIFNISTKGFSSGQKLSYEITLNDGSTIDFAFSLR